jgi:short-subunit dehydrogenase involved in D-alanine esterification of teichoic acids
MDITDWKAQEAIYDFSQKCYGKTINIVIIIAGILDSSNLINDTEQGQ